MKKEGIESKLDDYRLKLEGLKEAVEQKNQMVLSVKDMELQVREGQT